MTTMMGSEETAIRIAVAILRSYGQISVSEIRAIPFVQTDEEAMLIARSLAEAFDVEIQQVKQGSKSPVNSWVDILRLKPPA